MRNLETMRAPNKMIKYLIYIYICDTIKDLAYPDLIWYKRTEMIPPNAQPWLRRPRPTRSRAWTFRGKHGKGGEGARRPRAKRWGSSVHLFPVFFLLWDMEPIWMNYIVHDSRFLFLKYWEVSGLQFKPFQWIMSLGFFVFFSRWKTHCLAPLRLRHIWSQCRRAGDGGSPPVKKVDVRKPNETNETHEIWNKGTKPTEIHVWKKTWNCPKSGKLFFPAKFACCSCCQIVVFS